MSGGPTSVRHPGHALRAFGSLFRPAQVAPEDMPVKRFRTFVRRQLTQDGWSVADSRLVDLELRCDAITIGLLLGPSFYARRFPPVPQLLTFRVHTLRKIPHIRTNWLIVIVVHDAAMFAVFELNDFQPFSFLHWTQLDYLKGLRTGGQSDLAASPEQNDWTERLVMKNASLSRQRGFADLGAGNVGSAIEWAKRSIEMDRQDPIGYNLLTQLYLRSGEVDKAVETARHALDRADSSPISMLRMSQVELRMSNLPEALVWANKSLEEAPRNPWAHAHLAELYAAMGDPSEAVKAAAQAAELSPQTAYFAERLMYMRNLDTQARAKSDEENPHP